MKIIRATLNDIEKIAPLFNQYRIFYEQETDINGALNFLKERITKEESVIFIACEGETILGFTQLFYTFSSVSMQPSFILNDIFVDPQHRGNGYGEELLNSAKIFCISENYKGLALETANDNPAQKLYEKLGWKKDAHCCHYFWKAK